MVRFLHNFTIDLLIILDIYYIVVHGVLALMRAQGMTMWKIRCNQDNGLAFYIPDTT